MFLHMCYIILTQRLHIKSPAADCKCHVVGGEVGRLQQKVRNVGVLHLLLSDSPVTTRLLCVGTCITLGLYHCLSTIDPPPRYLSLLRLSIIFSPRHPARTGFGSLLYLTATGVSPRVAGGGGGGVYVIQNIPARILLPAIILMSQNLSPAV